MKSLGPWRKSISILPFVNPASDRFWSMSTLISTEVLANCSKLNSLWPGEGLNSMYSAQLDQPSASSDTSIV